MGSNELRDVSTPAFVFNQVSRKWALKQQKYTLTLIYHSPNPHARQISILCGGSEENPKKGQNTSKLGIRNKSSFCPIIKNKPGTGKTAQQLKGCIALVEDPAFQFPAPTWVLSKPSVTLGLQEPMFCPGLQGHLSSHPRTVPPQHTNVYNLKQILKTETTNLARCNGMQS